MIVSRTWTDGISAVFGYFSSNEVTEVFELLSSMVERSGEAKSKLLGIDQDMPSISEVLLNVQNAARSELAYEGDFELLYFNEFVNPLRFSTNCSFGWTSVTCYECSAFFRKDSEPIWVVDITVSPRDFHFLVLAETDTRNSWYEFLELAYNRTLSNWMWGGQLFGLFLKMAHKEKRIHSKTFFSRQPSCQ